MNVLIIGDSIVRGMQGESFVQPLARRHPDWKITNAGINGEPIRSIGRRLLGRLQAGQRYDVIVLQGGGNDIGLPTYADQNFWFRQALAHMRRQGHEPLGAADFERELRELVTQVQALTPAPVVLMTMGCMGEDLRAGLNPQRDIFNAAIRRVAAARGCALAEVAERFDEHLRRVTAPAPWTYHFWNTALGDKVQALLGRCDALSRQRGLHLTIDGVHLNRHGAALFADTLEEVLLGLEQRLLTQASRTAISR